MIIEFFSFYNEYDMLELKLQEHAPFVDRFVITESNRTYNQIPKPYRLSEQWQRYQQWHDKITYVQFNADGLEPGWPTEIAQREHAHRDMIFDPCDVLISSDLDEFLTPRDWHNLGSWLYWAPREVLFDTTTFFCFADMLYYRTQPCIAAVLHRNFESLNTHRRPMKVYENNEEQRKKSTVVPGGLHLSWFGNEEMFREKLEGSIEAYRWLNQRKVPAGRAWKDKQNNQLFHFKPKFGKDKVQHLPLRDNNIFSPSMKEYILQHSDWIKVKD